MGGGREGKVGMAFDRKRPPENQSRLQLLLAMMVNSPQVKLLRKRGFSLGPSTVNLGQMTHSTSLGLSFLMC